MSVAHDPTGPFHVTADPEAYVPRQASEEALATLAAYLRVGAPQVVLRGPTGIGKTLLLRVIAARLEGHLHVVHVPYPVLPPEEICSWILGLMGEPNSGDDERTLIALARRLRENGSGLAILIDDAASMPLPTVRRVSRVATEARPALRLVFALPDGSGGDDVVEALGPGVETVPFSEPMNRGETASYIEAHLARAQVPQRLRDGFDEEVVAAIQQDSNGIPRLVNALAVDWLNRVSRRLAEETRAPAAAAVAPNPGESRLGSSLLGPSGPAVADPWLGDSPAPDPVSAAQGPTSAAPADEPETTPVPTVETPTPVAATPAPSEPEPPAPEERPDPTAVTQIDIPVPPPAESSATADLPDDGEDGDEAVSSTELIPAEEIPPRPANFPRISEREAEETAAAARTRGASLGASRSQIAAVAAILVGVLAVGVAIGRLTGSGDSAGETATGGVAATETAANDPAPIAPERQAARDLLDSLAEAETAAQAAPEPTPPQEETPAVSAPPPGEPLAAAPAETTPEVAAAPTSAEPAEPATPAQEGDAADEFLAALRAEAGDAPEAESQAQTRTEVPPVATETAAVSASGDETGEAGAGDADEPVSVSVNAFPWAAIEVDGREVGITPLADLPLEVGEHEFRATLPDGSVIVRTERITTLNRRIVFP